MNNLTIWPFTLIRRLKQALKKFCSGCIKSRAEKDQLAINVILKQYVSDSIPWYIGYSGGKDSSALLTLVINAMVELKSYHKNITVIYCDTGVDIPTISSYVYNTLKKLKKECISLGIPLKFVIAKPKLNDRYFVKVIGRGYPPPTNIFRWCTDRLRINPVKSVINPKIENIVLLGVRLNESKERDRTIGRHQTNDNYFLKQSGSSKTKIFSPIINYTLTDVWSTLKFNDFPRSVDYNRIGELYKDAGSECPVYRETKGTPCGKGRFGCWTCTVVRQDKSVQSMIINGHSSLSPLYEFRNWLIKIRDDKQYRCSYRRNGVKGLGPINLNGRKKILSKLLHAQKLSGRKLIDDEEIGYIKSLWKEDIKNINYKES